MKLISLIKKEFYRFFRDSRLILTMLFPGILIFILYTLMGNLIGVENQEAETYAYKVYLSGSTQTTAMIETVVEASGSTLEWLPATDPEEAKTAVEKGEVTAYLHFSEDFDTAPERPVVEIYYSMNSGESSTFYALADAVLQEYGMRFTITARPFFDEDSMGAQIMAAILPFMIVVFVFSACMSVTLESVAGEKERGTLSTILVTSVPRFHVALGKIIPLSCISLIGATSSFLGVALSMPKLMGVSVGALGGYSFGSYAMLFFLIMSVVPLIVSVITAVSAYARSVKEASGYTSVLMISIMVLSLVTGFVSGIGNWVVAVPVLNAVVVMQNILSGALPVWQTLVSVGVNLLCTAVLVFAVSKMLSSEKIMFGK